MKRELTIARTKISDDTMPYIIAEIGCNHQGKLANAKYLFRGAHASGASAVKMQKRDMDALYTKEYLDRPYDNPDSFGATYGEHRRALEFGAEDWGELVRYAGWLHHFTFFATPFDIPSADFLRRLNMPAYKIASGDITNIPLLRRVAEFGKPVLISTGGASMDDVKRAHDTIIPINQQLCIMQCTSEYPARPAHANLRVIQTYRETFPGVVIGLSDHTEGTVIPLVAYQMGARIIEKHFTQDKTWKGTDQHFSLNMPDMDKLERMIKKSKHWLGNGEKKPHWSERAASKKLGKSLVAARDLPAGHVIHEDDIAIKSPGGGLKPHRIDELVGRRVARDMVADEAFSRGRAPIMKEKERELEPVGSR